MLASFTFIFNQVVARTHNDLTRVTTGEPIIFTLQEHSECVSPEIGFGWPRWLSPGSKPRPTQSQEPSIVANPKQRTAHLQTG
jgi:hypothetical protein